jgi:hypothetical protein
MSTLSIIAIKGNHLNHVAELFAPFRYVDLNNDKQFDFIEKASTYLNLNYFNYTKRDIALRGLWLNNDWTIILDPETVDTVSENPLSLLSRSLDSEVLTFIIQTNSGSYGFSKYQKTKQRAFMVSDGEVIEEFGEPLTEEKDLNINENIFTDDILKLADKFGIDLQGSSTKTFVIKELGYTEELKKELEPFRKAPAKQLEAKAKSWWKFW